MKAEDRNPGGSDKREELGINLRSQRFFETEGIAVGIHFLGGRISGNRGFRR